MNIQKKHKLYIRNKKSGQIRNLNKYDAHLYTFVIVSFLTGGYNEKYSEANKDVKHWKDWRAIILQLTHNLNKRLEKLIKEGYDTVVSYDGSWRPLCQLTLNPDEIEVVTEE